MAAEVAGGAMSEVTVVVSVQKVAAKLAQMAAPMVEATSAVNAALRHAGMRHAVSSAVTCVATFAVNNAASKKSKARNRAKRVHRVSLGKAAVLSAHAVNAVNATNAQQSSALQPMLLSKTLQQPTVQQWQPLQAVLRQMLARKRHAVNGVSGAVNAAVAMNAVMSLTRTCVLSVKTNARTLLKQRLPSHPLRVKATKVVRATSNARHANAAVATVMAANAVNVRTAQVAMKTAMTQHCQLRALCQMRLQPT